MTQPRSKKETIKSGPKAESKLPGFLPLYNYACLAWVSAFIAIGLLPDEAQRYFEKILWNLPVIASGTILIGLFFIFNRKTIGSILSDSILATGQSSDAGEFHGVGFGQKAPAFSMLMVGLLVVSGFMLFSYKLDGADFWEDEYLSINAAEGYHQSGTYAAWDFIRGELSHEPYMRGWPHTWLVAQSFRIFGVSEWSSRIVSVVCGCAFIGMSFFVACYFFADRLFALLMALVFLLNPDYIYYWRHARMYALLLPCFLMLAFAVFKAMEGKQSHPASSRVRMFSIRELVNFDYLFIALSLALLYLNYSIHVNSLIIGISACVYVLVMAGVGRDKKFIALLMLILMMGSVGYYLLPKPFFNEIIYNKKFFQGVHLLYARLMAAKPLFPALNMMFLVSSVFIFPMATKDAFRRRLLYCYLIVLTAMVFFVFVVEYYGRHYRYISHITSFAILIICFSYVTMLKVFQSKPILVSGLILLIAVQSINFFRLADTLYHGIPGQSRPSKAYEAVKKNIKEDEAIFAQYLRGYYMQGIPRNTKVINLGKVENDTPGTNPYTFDRFFKDIHEHKTGWVIWEKPKEYHVDPKVAAYVKTLFKKAAGEGIDDFYVEIYYFNDAMIRTPNFK